MILFRSIAIAIILALTLTAHGNNEKPEAIAKSYIDAALNIDIEKAIKYSSKEHIASILEGLEYYSIKEEELKEKRDAAKKELEGITYKIIEVEAEEDKATIYAEFAKDDNTKEGKVELIKEDGTWRVNKEKIPLYFF